jgi:hypothetical protein
MDKFKKKDIVWDNILEVYAIVYSKPCLLAYNNGIGYGIKLLTGQNIGKRLYVKESELILVDRKND